jgi:hypothetical protein
MSLFLQRPTPCTRSGWREPAVVRRAERAGSQPFQGIGALSSDQGLERARNGRGKLLKIGTPYLLPRPGMKTLIKPPYNRMETPFRLPVKSRSPYTQVGQRRHHIHLSSSAHPRVAALSVHASRADVEAECGFREEADIMYDDSERADVEAEGCFRFPPARGWSCRQAGRLATMKACTFWPGILAHRQ